MHGRPPDILLLTPAEQLVFNRFGVRLRYAAVVTAVVFSAVAGLGGFYPEFPVAGVFMLAGFVCAYNTAGWLVLRGLETGDNLRGVLTPLQRALTLLDQLVIVLAIYVLGGLEVFVLPVLLLAMFMVAINTGKKESYRFFASAMLMVGCFFVLQHFGVVAYHSAVPVSLTGTPAPAQNPITDSWIALSLTWTILGVLLFGVVYFSNFVKDKYARVFTEILAGRQEITSLRKLSADVLDIFPFAVVTVDAAGGRVEGANPAAVTLLGAHLGWIGRRVGEIDELQANGLAVYFERALAGDAVKLTDFPLVGAAGRRKLYLSITVFIARKPDGSPDKILFCAEDISERLRREAEQRELQQALLQTEKMASLGQMAAGVAHELNNPLTAIDAYAQYLVFKLRSGESVGPENLQRVERILENSDRIRLLVKNLLSYARPAPETSTPVSVNNVIDEALVFCEHDLRKHGVELVKQYAEPPPRMVGNRTQLQQVFVNLVTNAVHAVEPNAGRIEITTAQAGAAVEICVRDNGAGIARDQLERIFEPFYTTKPAGKGTGLGLSIVMTIVENHAGSIRVESEAGRGTTMHMRLPAGQPAAM